MDHKHLKLTIELVPQSAWNNNLRHILPKNMWDDIRKKVYEKYDFTCAICKKHSKKLHAHEVWDYNDTTHIQQLQDIIPLCTLCHLVKHPGFASIHESRGGAPMAVVIAHFKRVNKVDGDVFREHYKEELVKFEERSKYEWTMDVSLYKDSL